MAEKLLTRTEVSEMLAISLRSVDRLRQCGILPTVKVFRIVRFREADVLALIASQRSLDR